MNTRAHKTGNKKPAFWRVFAKLVKAYLFITYIVTSKPKRISVAAGFVHIMISLSSFKPISIDVLV
jgi:hypothetical protein